MPKKNHPNPGDQRSNVKNPNNPAYHHDQANRAAQREQQQEEPASGSNSKGQA